MQFETGALFGGWLYLAGVPFEKLGMPTRFVAEEKRYEEITKNMWDNLPHNYKWLRDWEWV